jgi:hypothetical protein
MIGCVYVLKDKKGVPFYVGATIGYAQYRLSVHRSVLKTVGKTYTAPVYGYMKRNRIIPAMEILESKNYRTKEALLRSETRWIKRLRKQGIYLANKCLTKRQHQKII